MFENICLDSLLVRQLKHRGFICNALNCLNEENKRFSNCLFLSLYLIFFSSSLALYLNISVRQLKCIGFICNIFNCLNEENKRFTNYLFLYFSFYFLLLSLYIICNAFN
jgi:hypothetical protein